MEELAYTTPDLENNSIQAEKVAVPSGSPSPAAKSGAYADTIERVLVTSLTRG